MLLMLVFLLNGKMLLAQSTNENTEPDSLISEGSGLKAMETDNESYISGAISKGGSVLTVYMENKGMFTPHENNCGNDAFVPIFNGANIGFCIEKNEREARTWSVAEQTCLSSGKRLPEVNEWQAACKIASSLGLLKMTETLEWGSNFPRSYYDDDDSKIIVYIPILGSGGCNKIGMGNLATSDNVQSVANYRCVH